MKFPLKWKEYLILVIIFALLYIFTITQKLYLPEHIRPFTLLVVVIAGMYLFFQIVKPLSPYKLSRFLSFWFGLIVAVIIIILHVIIRHDISYKAVVIFSVTVASPFIVGFIYKKIRN